MRLIYLIFHFINEFVAKFNRLNVLKTVRTALIRNSHGYTNLPILTNSLY